MLLARFFSGVRMRDDLAWCRMSSTKPPIRKVELLCLDKALYEIAVMRHEQMDDVAGLKHRQPRLGSIAGNAAVVRQRRQVDELICATAIGITTNQ
ncbi:MAG: hypothetical protein HY273_03315 [Gammaproteobacteria bacterium]|nr:hypothetical protein [Gammaproteobacteria bacterium]